MGLDPAGRPLYLNMGSQITNSPYDLNLARNVLRGLPSLTLSNTSFMLNNPYGPAELETILRPFDRDASGLPSRLATMSQIAPSYIYSLLQAKRYELTTDSWDTPAP